MLDESLISKRIRVGVPVLALFLAMTPLIIPNVFGLTYSLMSVPARTTETSVNSATSVALALNVSQASLGTTYQFNWAVTDPSGTTKNHNNQTVATASTFQISLEYPRDFSTNMILAGNYSVVINQNQPTGATNPVSIGKFTIGLTDKLVYQRGNRVLVSAAGYGNGERVTINIHQGSTSYPISTNADTSGQVSYSWLIPASAPMGTLTTSLTGQSTTKTPPDTQTFLVNPNVTLSALTLGQAALHRTQTESVTFTANYPNASRVQTGTAKIRLSDPMGQSVFATAVYNSTATLFEGSYLFPVSARAGGWLAAVDPGMFNDSYGNTNPSAVLSSFTVLPTNVTIGQLNVSQATIQHSQTQRLSFAARYPKGAQVQTGSATVRITETDGTTSFTTIAGYNATAGVFQATSKIPDTSQTGAWVASIDPSAFDDGFGNTGPQSSFVRAFAVQPTTMTVSASIPSQTFTVGQVIPIYAIIIYPDGSLVTAGNVTVTISSSTVQIGSTAMTFVQGQSQWVGAYTVKSNDTSGVWLVTVKVSDAYQNTGQETISAIVNVPPSTPTQPLNLYYFIVTALALGSGGSGLLLLRRFNSTHGGFDEFFKLVGGEIPPGTTLLILGDPGSGMSTLSQEIIHHQLTKGKQCGLLTYDAFPSEVIRAMRGFGWDPTPILDSGTLRILDCYSALAGAENAPIRDPVDFTEISIQVSRIIENGSQGPITLVLDSITPIFNSAPARTVINFLRVLSAKVKNSGGILILTGTKGSIPNEVKSNLETTVDGVIELSTIRGGQTMIRTLTVQRVSGRKVSSYPTEFEIVPGKGMLFRKLRVPLRIISPKRRTES